MALLINRYLASAFASDSVVLTLRRIGASLAHCLCVGLLGLAPVALGAEAAGALSPGDRFQDCAVCPQMVVVPAGVFVMGSSSSEEGHEQNESPQHRVRIGRPFAVGVYEVTFDEWDACEWDFGCGNFGDDNGWGRGQRPVINVSWNDAQEYVGWLSERTGKAYRLLSESEWEYVARAGTTTPFHFGWTISTDEANYDGDSTYGGGTKGIDRGKTVPVGQFPANGFGLHDVHGNVWEWVEDCWNGSYDGASRDGSAWSTGECELRVLRGGSWVSDPGFLRAAFRNGGATGGRSDLSGFRVARTLTP